MTIYYRSSAAAAAILCAAVHADITETAPADVLMVITIPDVAQLKAAFADSPLNDLWKHPEVQAFVTAFIEEAEDDVTENASLDWWSELEYFDGEPITTRDLWLDHLFPDISVGLAFWENADRPDDEPEMILHADYGDRADQIQDLFEQALDRGLEDELITYEEEEYGPATIFSVNFTDVEIGDESDDQIELYGIEVPLGVSRFWREMHIARLGDVFLIGGSIEAVRLAVDASDGDAVTLAESENHQAFLAQHPDDLVAYAYARPDLFFGSAQVADDLGMGMLSMLFDELGITSIESVGASFLLGGEGALVSSRFTVLMPEKIGIATLLDLDRDGYAPPPFAGADTAQINSLLFDFKGVLPLAHQIAAGLPDDQRQWAEMQISQAEGMVGPLFDVLGPNVHVIERYRRPFAFDSRELLFAVQLSDELVATNLITVFGGMVGLEARRFEGGQIYEAEGAPFSVGIGGGHAFIGKNEMVENALRRAADPGQSSLASEPGYVAAAQEIKGTGNLIGYSNTARVVEYGLWMLKNVERIKREIYERLGLEGEELDDLLATLRDDTPAFLALLPSAEVVSEIVGDQIWEMRSTDEGFVLEARLMPAGD